MENETIGPNRFREIDAGINYGDNPKRRALEEMTGKGPIPSLFEAALNMRALLNECKTGSLYEAKCYSEFAEKYAAKTRKLRRQIGGDGSETIPLKQDAFAFLGNMESLINEHCNLLNARVR